MTVEKKYDGRPESVVEDEVIEPGLKSDIPIIQAWRDTKISQKDQKEKVASREQLIKNLMERIDVGLSGLESLGFDLSKITAEYSCSFAVFGHALFDNLRVFHERKFWRTTLAELPAVIAEQAEYLRQHALMPETAPDFQFVRINFGEAITEADKQAVWLREARVNNRTFLEHLFRVLGVFVSVFEKHLDASYLVEFDWQKLEKTKKQDQDFFALENFSPQTGFSLQDYFKKDKNWQSEEKPKVLRLLTMSNRAAFSEKKPVAENLALSDYDYFSDRFAEEMGGPLVSGDYFKAMTPADARSYIKKFFPECFKFYPERDGRLSELLPDSEDETCKKIPEVLKTLFAGLIF